MSEINPIKLFTVDEANRMLPRVSGLIDELRLRRDAILASEVEIDVLEIISPKDADGVSGAVTRKVEEYHKLLSRFYSLIDEIHGLGCFLKDVDQGLIDFYSSQAGKVVYLCWKYGEPTVGFWHDVEKGFLQREPISPKQKSKPSE